MNEQLQELGLSRTRWYAARADLLEKGWVRLPESDGEQIDLLVGFEQAKPAKLLKSRETGNQQLTDAPPPVSDCNPVSRDTGRIPNPGTREINNLQESSVPQCGIAYRKNIQESALAARARAHEEISGPADDFQDFGGIGTKAPSGKLTNGAHPASRYSLDTVERYVLAERKDARSPLGFARTIWLSGDNDAKITAWLERVDRQAKPPPQPSCPKCQGKTFYRSPTPEEPMRNVTCEACKGTGVLNQ